jgi:hypothetical protein
MTWTILRGPVDAVAEIPEGEPRGSFDGDVYRFEITHESGVTTSVWVRFSGTLAASERSNNSERVNVALATQGRAELERRREDPRVPRCITFTTGTSEPIEDEECHQPLS